LNSGNFPSHNDVFDFIRRGHRIFSLSPLYPNPIQNKLTVGIIPDGNRRWAKSLNKRPGYGHLCGSNTIVETIFTAIRLQCIDHLVIYVLSYDNFQKRSPQEQSDLLHILTQWTTELNILLSIGIPIQFQIIGEPTDSLKKPFLPLTEHVLDKIPSLKVSFLVCYDGQREIQQSNGNPEQLWLKDDINLVIRTGNTRRSSGFCLYQTSYSEWYYLKKMWPDFNGEDFRKIILH